MFKLICVTTGEHRGAYQNLNGRIRSRCEVRLGQEGRSISAFLIVVYEDMTEIRGVRESAKLN